VARSLIVKMPVTIFDIKEKYRYQNGFDSYHEYVNIQPLVRSPSE